MNSLLNTINQVLITIMYTLVILVLTDIYIHPTILDDLHTHIHLNESHTKYIETKGSE